MLFFFFSSRRRHTILQGDWSSDVCSSDLMAVGKTSFDDCPLFTSSFGWTSRSSPRRPPRISLADRKSTRLNSSHLVISYAVFCLKKKKKQEKHTHRLAPR